VTEAPSLYGPVAEDIPAVGDVLAGLSEGHHPLLGATLAHIFETGGKRIRPALVLLSGKLGTYQRDRLVTLAASLEVVHTATLVHDDTIDQALTRRGLQTINALWDGKVAILVGDFLLAQSAELASRLDSVRIMSLLSQTVMDMSSGELRQYAASQSHTLDEADYFARIGGKTASLFAMCCEGAGVLSGQSEECIGALRSYGTNFGLAFQIVDDVLDFVGDAQSLGKPAGNDLRQGTITLPVIMVAQALSGDSALRQDIERGRNPDGILAAVRESGAADRALDRAREYARAACSDLCIFPASQAKEVLLELTQQVIDRRR